MVILVITVVSAMILPELRGSLEETLLRDSARQITGACTVARDRAVASGRTHRLRIESTSGRFHVEPDPGTGTGRSAPPWIRRALPASLIPASLSARSMSTPRIPP